MKTIGIDLGTSSVKLILVDEAGKILKTVSKGYPIFFPRDGWSEQNPDDWWDGVINGLKELIRDTDRNDIAGIGLGGQMHGLVILDEIDKVIRPAILWNDGRTAAETDWLNDEIGKDILSSYTANIAFAGFTAPKLLWLKKNEPDNFARIKKIMLPKDYIVYRFTGVHSCDYSDASGMLLLDVKNKCWSEEMLDICGISSDFMPKLFESYEAVGTVKAALSDELGLTDNVKVAAGAGDNAAAAIGTGVISDGQCNISLGTSGTVFISTDSFHVDCDNSLHAFDHANGRFHLMGCMLSAASCNKWFMDDILNTDDYQGMQESISYDRLGENRVYFLPYLMGERCPYNDPQIRGCFIGLSMNTTREEMYQAVLEGVAFGLRDSIETARKMGIKIDSSFICGGGAKSELWKKIIANVMNLRLDIPVTEEGPSYGGAMLAAVACGKFENIKQVAERFISVKDSVYPDEALVKKYETAYKKYHSLYKMIYPAFH